MAKAVKFQRQAEKALETWVTRMGSLAAVSRATGLNVGYLSRVLHGKRPPSRRLLCVLGIGRASTTFEDRSNAYDIWKRDNLTLIQSILEAAYAHTRQKIQDDTGALPQQKCADEVRSASSAEVVSHHQ
jgi:hypothetical protein